MILKDSRVADLRDPVARPDPHLTDERLRARQAGYYGVTQWVISDRADPWAGPFYPTLRWPGCLPRRPVNLHTYNMIQLQRVQLAAV